MAADSQNSARQEVLPVSEGPLGCSGQEVRRAEWLASIASGTGLQAKDSVGSPIEDHSKVEP
jgi:hypothetical protein